MNKKFMLIFQRCNKVLYLIRLTLPPLKATGDLKKCFCKSCCFLQDNLLEY